MNRSKRKSPAGSKRVKRIAKRRAPGKGGASAVERALASLAHEIRTPLNGVLALAELLIASDLPARERAWASAIKQGALHLDALTTVVVDSVRSRAAGLTPKTEAFSPRAFAETLATSLHARAAVKGLAPRIAIAEDLPPAVVGDAVRLRAIIENLFDNAVKFTEKGHVDFSFTVEARGRRGLRLAAVVADEGVGLSQSEMRRLFRPFSQASAAVARRFGGTGLGLAFAARVAAALGGKLSVTSAPGEGSAFQLVAPLSRPRAQASEAGSARAEGASPPPAPLRILCAEDNPYGRAVLNAIVSELGHAADFVGTGEAAVEAVACGGYGLVLMDVTLAGMSGVEATRAVRALTSAAARIPIIGISGHADAHHEAAARAAGMNAYLVKPIGPRALAEAIARVTAA